MQDALLKLSQISVLISMHTDTLLKACHKGMKYTKINGIRHAYKCDVLKFFESQKERRGRKAVTCDKDSITISQACIKYKVSRTFLLTLVHNHHVFYKRVGNAIIIDIRSLKNYMKHRSLV